MDDEGNYFWNPEIGGCSKSTTTAIIAHLLREDGYKVLVVDMDCQGNITELFTNEGATETVGSSVLEALYERDARPYIMKIDDNLDLLPSNNLLVHITDFYYTGKTYLGEVYPAPSKNTHKMKMLSEILETVKDNYDYILIDTPPALSTETTNSLYAADWVVILYECSKFCYSAIPNFLETLQGARAAGNSNVQIAGILRTLNDARRSDMKYFADLIQEDYPDYVFNQLIKRSAPVGRLSIHGFEDNPELKSALNQHKEFYKELLERVGAEQKESV